MNSYITIACTHVCVYMFARMQPYISLSPRCRFSCLVGRSYIFVRFTSFSKQRYIISSTATKCFETFTSTLESILAYVHHPPRHMSVCHMNDVRRLHVSACILVSASIVQLRVNIRACQCVSVGFLFSQKGGMR